jgi:hypothetical protein
MQNFGVHLQSHEERERKFVCDFPGCDKSYLDATGLRVHKVLHSDDTHPFPCTVCSKRFVKKKALTAHMISHSEDTKPFKCPSLRMHEGIQDRERTQRPRPHAFIAAAAVRVRCSRLRRPLWCQVQRHCPPQEARGLPDLQESHPFHQEVRHCEVQEIVLLW